MSRFSIPLDALAAKSKLSIATVARKVTLDLFRAVVLRSPVDTGRFRANWNASIGAPNYATTGATNQSRGLSEAARAASLPIGGVNYLSNGLPYAARLESGYSKQAPAGMVRLAALEYNDYVRKAIQ